MIAAVRIRGSVKTRKEIKYTMKLLRLHSVNHAVIVEEKMRPMLKKTEAFITFGEINRETLSALLEKRGRLEGDKRIPIDFLEKHKLKSFDEMAEKILEKKVTLRELGIKPVFRLNSPKKGHERQGIKKPFAMGGALGDRGDGINKLIAGMM